MSHHWVIERVDLVHLQRLAEQLSLFVRAGDVVLLHGGLGAGKTAFARYLIRALLGDDGVQEIPSPTFSLVQSYDTPRMAVMHFDFYRLQDDAEALELGLDEDSQGLKIIEWPERVSRYLPETHLAIRLEDNSVEGLDIGDDERRVTFEGFGDWALKLQRMAQMHAFLEMSDWQEARLSYLQGDASARAYGRLQDGTRAAILMDSPRAADGPPVRDGKSYSEIAHLAEDVAPFVAVAEALSAANIRVPDIFAHDLEHGFLVLEDLGTKVFGGEIVAGADMLPLWRMAVDVLLELRKSPPSEQLALPGGGVHQLASYDVDALMIEVELLADWYWRYARGEDIPTADRDGFISVWRPIAETLSTDRDAWVLRDYHSPNLMLLEGEGHLRVGVIDFQDALRGHAAYDLVSLLQDARLDVPDAIEAELLQYYCDQVRAFESDFDETLFRSRYAMFGAQRNTKILGIFARLSARDNKHGYLSHLPRIWRYMKKNLAHQDLHDLKQWHDLKKWYVQKFPTDLEGL